MTLKKGERILEIERGSTRSRSVETSLWKRLKAGLVVRQTTE
jgi:hypothetical protein